MTLAVSREGTNGRVLWAQSQEWGLEVQTEGRGPEDSPSWSSRWPGAKQGWSAASQEAEQWLPGVRQDPLKPQDHVLAGSSKVVTCTARGHTVTGTGGAGTWPRLEALGLKQRNWT